MKKLSSSEIIPYQTISLFGLLLTALFLLIGYGIQYFYHIEPCPLCLIQRYFLLFMLIVFFMSVLHNPLRKGRLFYGLLLVLFALLGLLASGRQIWLQQLPTDQLQNCTADLERLIKLQPILQVFKTLVTSHSECTKIDFTFLGLSLAQYSFMGFLGLLFYIILFFPFKSNKYRINKVR